VRGDLVGQRLVPRRIDAIETGRADGDGVAVGSQRALVRGAVDAERETRGDDEAAPRQFGGEGVRVVETLRRRRAAADDGDLRQTEQIGIALPEQQRRRLRDVAQRRRIARISDRQQAAAGQREPVEVAGDAVFIGLLQRVGLRSRQTGAAQRRLRRGERRVRRTEGREQLRDSGAS
jgi:hypothetical protein